MPVKKQKLFPEEDYLRGKRLEAGGQSFWTPPASSQPKECPIAPVKRRRQNEEPAWERLVRENTHLTVSNPLTSYSKSEKMSDEPYKGYNNGQLEDTTRALLVREGDELVESPLRLCPNLEKISDAVEENMQDGDRVCQSATDDSFVSRVALAAARLLVLFSMFRLS